MLCLTLDSLEEQKRRKRQADNSRIVDRRGVTERHRDVERRVILSAFEKSAKAEGVPVVDPPPILRLQRDSLFRDGENKVHFRPGCPLGEMGDVQSAD